MTHLREVLVILLEVHHVLSKRHGLILDLERPIIHPHRDRSFRQSPLPVELPILKAQKPIFVQIARVVGDEQNTVEELRWVHRTFVPREDLNRAVAAVLTLFVSPVALHIVIAHPLAVDGDHLFPRRGPCELGVCHFSDDIEVRLNQILPGLPLLDAQLFNPWTHPSPDYSKKCHPRHSPWLWARLRSRALQRALRDSPTDFGWQRSCSPGWRGSSFREY